MNRKRLVSLLAAAACTFIAHSATLVWDDPNPHGAVASFRVWREVAPGQWTNIAKVSTNRWPIVLPPGANKIAVSAVSVEGLESDRSTNKFLTVLIVPGNLRIEQ